MICPVIMQCKILDVTKNMDIDIEKRNEFLFIPFIIHLVLTLFVVLPVVDYVHNRPLCILKKVHHILILMINACSVLHIYLMHD